MSAESVAPPAMLRTRQVRPAGVVLVALGALIGVVLGGATGGAHATFQLSAIAATLQVGEIALPARTVTIACGAIVVLAGLALLTAPRHGVGNWAPVAVAISAATVAFLCWAVAGRSINLSTLAAATVTGALPLLFGALAGVLCERSGVINIAVEGQFLLSAFAASVLASLAGVWIGLFAGILAGAAIGALLALLAIRYHADQVIVGFVLNLLVVGLTGFLFSRVVVPNQASLGSPDTFPGLTVPGLSQLPVVGSALFDQDVMLYVAIALLVAIHVMLRRTRWGLRTLAVGENPEAADSAGVNVLKVRYRNVIAGGVVAGLGGVYLTLGSVGAFGPGISAGKGFIGLAVLIFGRWNPLGALLGALLFGLADAIQSTLSIVGSPILTELLQMFPYVVTIFVVAGLVGKVRPPAADGKPFVR